MRKMEEEKYDVALSFAGEDRRYAKELADLLEADGYSCFYDENERANLWGKDLYKHLSSVYKDQARYCVMFLSENYAQKLWTNQERKSAQARAFQESREYILPVRLDDTEIPGILSTVSYLDLRLMTITEIYQNLVKKLSHPTSQATGNNIRDETDPEMIGGKSFKQEHYQNYEKQHSGVEKAIREPLKGFITYSHEDAAAKDKLRERLAIMEQKNELTTWHHGQITAGDEWYENISKNLAGSDILLYLVSAASLSSKNCNKELAEALTADIKVIPIILEHCDWEPHQLAKFEVLPLKGKPISNWEDPSEGWQNVVDGIRGAINKMQSQVDPSSSTSEEELRAELAFEQGNVQFLLGQMDKAIAAYSRSIELNSQNAEAYTNRGIAYDGKGEHDLAIKDHTTAIKYKLDHPEAYNNRGVSYAYKGDFDAAIEDYTTAIKHKPDHVKAYNNRGVAYDGKGEHDLAIEDYTTAIKHKPDFVEAYNNRGVSYADKGDFDAAIEDYTKAMDLKSDYVNTNFNRGLTYDRKGEYDLAIKDYTTAIKHKPDHAKAYNNRGTVYEKKGEYDLAIKDYTTAIKYKLDHPEAYSNRGRAYTAKGEFDRAIADCNKAIELNPEFANAYNNRGIAYAAKGELNSAIDNFTKAIELNPDCDDAYYNRGMMWLGLQEWEDFRSNLSAAGNVGIDIAIDFRNTFGSVANFEREAGIQLPEDIAALLTLPQP